MSKLLLSTIFGLALALVSISSQAQTAPAAAKTVKVHYKVYGDNPICEGDSTMPVQPTNRMHANSPENLIAACKGLLPGGQVADIGLYGLVAYGDDGNFYVNAAFDLNHVTPIQTGALVFLVLPISIASQPFRFTLANDGTSISNQPQTVIAMITMIP